jgi:hypothetical protein
MTNTGCKRGTVGKVSAITPHVGRKLVNILLLPILVLSCVWVTRIEFKPLDKELPVTMFGKYKISFGVVGPGAPNLRCYIDFLSYVSPTADTNTIPIFIIDSLCFEADCVNSKRCYQPQSDYDRGAPSRDGPFNPGTTKDLDTAKGEMIPRGYKVSKAPCFPDSCVKTEATVVIWARLVDRVSKRGISAEEKRVQFNIKKHSGLYPVD